MPSTDQMNDFIMHVRTYFRVTVFTRSLDPFYIEGYYMIWVKTSRTDSAIRYQHGAAETKTLQMVQFVDNIFRELVTNHGIENRFVKS